MKYLLVYILFFAAHTNAQTNAIKNNLEGQAQIMGDAFLKKDYATLQRFTHPTIIKLLGGENNFIDTLEMAMKKMEADSFMITEITFGEPSKIITVEQDLQATLTQVLIMKVPKGTLVASSTLIAVSKDKGKNWVFVDASDKDMQQLKKIIPNLSAELDIPEKQKPIFVAD